MKPRFVCACAYVQCSCSPPHGVNMASRERLFDVEFVEGPPEDWECPICKHTLLVPHLLSCCGKHLCDSCGRRLQGRPCPLCKEKFTTLLDKGRQRNIWQAKVHCPNSESGCEWQGELRDLLRHLTGVGGAGGESPRHRGPPSLCSFEPAACANEGCRQQLARRDVERHQRSECPHRRLVCQYCSAVETTYAEMTGTHWAECPDFPVSCPNNCDAEEMRRCLVQAHCDRDCRLQLVRCPYAEVGCGVKRPRRELLAHVNSTGFHHGELLVKKTVDIQAKQEAAAAKMAGEMESATSAMQEQLRRRDQVIQRLSDEAAKRMEELAKFIEDTDAQFEALHVEFEAKLGAKNEQIQSLEKQLRENCEGVGKVEAELAEKLAELEGRQATQLREVKVEMEEKTSEKFEKAIGELEAKLMEEIKAKPAKEDFEKLEHDFANKAKCFKEMEEKLTAKIKEVTPKQSPSEERAALKKELSDSVKRTLEEQLKAARETLRAEQNTELEAGVRERKAAEEKLSGDLAREKEEVETLKNKLDGVSAAQTEQVIVGQRLEGEVGKIRKELSDRIQQIMSEVNYIEKAATPTPPFSFTVTRFTKRREKKDSYVSDAFYTSRRGYRMVVRVDAAGTDTHVSVWCCITRGQHDHVLPWPLRADIFIRLINQRDKEKFYERQISYDQLAKEKHAGRVVTGDKNYLWGLREFITMREITAGQFLMGDALDFVVHKVELKEMDRPVGN